MGERKGRGAIAVVGMACRVPDAPSPPALWRLLAEGRNAITETPARRWALCGVAEPNSTIPELQRGGFLEDVDRFDAGFFGIGPREATAMDPQQRLALELSWEALENAAISPAAIAGSEVGVFVGAIAADYEELLHRGRGDEAARQAFTGTQRSIIANRISYTLGLRGPSVAVDTGQSSSLVAVHMACQSLLAGECSLALAGGVQLNLGLHRALALAKLGALSPDGRCYVFDARANGFVRGEGGGLVVLKPLDRALADADCIYCVLRGSAVNNDGGGDSLTAPDRSAQERLLALAYERAGVSTAEVQYVELHGTGTRLGDTVEAGALGAVIGTARKPGRLLLVGSAKTNVGHLEAAAGVLGLIKVALAIEHGELPPSLNYEQPSPEIALDELGLEVQVRCAPWPRRAPPLAGVSSFGLGGTNCHVVVEAPPQERARAGVERPNEPIPWVLSTKNDRALRASAEQLAEHVRAAAELSSDDVGLTLAVGRSSLAHRAVVVGAGREQLLAGLASLAEARLDAHVIEGVAAPHRSAAPVFAFPGQGGQWPGMAAELLERSHAFAAELHACDEAFARYLDVSMTAVLRGEEAAALERIDVLQPALFSVMVALAKLWTSHGVRPAAVIGHSQGEVAAAYVAGALTLDDAARIMAVRSRILSRTGEGGGMLALALTPDALRERVGHLGDQIGIAAVNAPASLVASGDVEALSELARACDEDGIDARPVAVSVAAHSPRIDPLREEFLRELGPIEPAHSDLPMYSTVTGAVLDTASMGAEYWYRNLRQTVLFSPAVAAALRDGHRTFVEVGPHPVLTLGIHATADEQPDVQEELATVATLRRSDGGLERFLGALAEAYVHGVEVDWSARFAGTGARRKRLPTYPFQRERFWINAPPPGDVTVPQEYPADANDGAAASQDVRVEAVSEAAFAERVHGLPEQQRAQAVLDLVLAEAAAVLGHASPDAIDSGLAFKDLGVDSLAAVELRNRLGRVTGLRLPASLVFDFPRPVDVARRLLSGLVGEVEVVERKVGLVSPRVDEPVAIVGMGCRFPGGVRSAVDLWRLVVAGGDATGEFPLDRGWDLERLFGGGEGSGASYVRRGGFVYEAAEFDAEHFGISPREALAMDPQQRLLLECVWEALEDAGLDPQGMRGSSAGVYVGAMSQDYGPPMHQQEASSEGYALTGTTVSVISGRVAYVLGLEGPAVSVDTACSSSLVALHLACQALRAGECSLALTGGATLMASPGIFVEFSRQQGLSPDGRCRAFAAGANGTGWSEGVGVLVLEPLSVAREKGHRVLAVVCGSAVNQDGASNGLTAPSGRAQERVIGAALAAAGLAPGDVDVVEGHGTGTVLGDPIEAGALIGAYGGGGRERPLWLGSVKSNLGHAQAAAGVAGVIKMVMALREGLLPATLWVDEPSPHVDWDLGGVRLLREAVEWPAGERVRRVGVSSFGISGTNAHVILEEAPLGSAGGVGGGERGLVSGVAPFLVSGSSEAALVGQAGRLASFVRAERGLDWWEVAAGLAVGRAQLPQRAVVFASGLEELAGRLEGLGRGEWVEGVVRGVARRERRVGFVFPGQGSQWPGMALGLWEASPVFAASMRACGEALARYVDWSLEEVLRGVAGAPALERVDVVQGALFCVMVSLAELWRSFGVEPVAVVGHSQGEIAAACVAGALSLEDAARVVAVRALAVGEVLSGRGGMVSLAASLPVVERYLQRVEGLSVAAVNGPSAVVVSGEPAALERLVALCEEEGVRARRLPVDYASHSPAVDLLAERLAADLAPVVPRSAEVAFYSATEACLLDGAALEGGYWLRNLRRPVLFAEATRAMLAAGVTALIELSPHPVLTAAIEQTIEQEGLEGISLLDSLHRDDGGSERYLHALAEAHTAGITIDWTRLFGRDHAAGIPLPTYAFQHRHYWHTPARKNADPTALGQTPVQHPLLGAALPLADGQETVFTGRLSLEDHAWLADHVVLGRTLLPATVFLELALQAASETGAGSVAELTISNPLILEPDTTTAIQVRVTGPDENGQHRLAIHSQPDTDQQSGRPWAPHATGTLNTATWAPGARPASQSQQSAFDRDAAYARLAEAGYDYGPAFQGVRRIARTGDEVLVDASLADEQHTDAQSFSLHPALLDAALQAGLLAGLDAGAPEAVAVPFSFSGVRLHNAGARALQAGLTLGSEGWRLEAVDDDGEPVISIDSVVTRPIARSQLESSDMPLRDALYAVRWAEVEGARAVAGATVAVLGDVPVDGDSGLPFERYGDLDALEYAVAAGATAPDQVVAVPTPLHDGGSASELAHDVAAYALRLLQGWVKSEQLSGSKLVLITRNAVAVHESERPDLAQAVLPGLLRSATTEHPGRFALIDLDGNEGSWDAVGSALARDEPELAIRNDRLYVPRLERVRRDRLSRARWGGDAWHVALATPGSFESLEVRRNAEADAPLGPGQVRVAVHAAGLNFADVVKALDLLGTGETDIGLEGAGVVLEVGDGVSRLEPGDRVMGLIPNAFGSVAVADSRMLTRFPADWSFLEAASVPAVFLTAYYGLFDLACLDRGERVLIHGAAGGVGMAALQLAAHRGAEVFATAHPGKWPVLAALGLDDQHVASSRNTEFREAFLAATGGRGLDVVLDSLAGEMVDASLDLLQRGGRFVEMGKTDIRDLEAVGAAHPGVRYEAFDLLKTAPERIGEMLSDIVALFEKGALRHLPRTTFDVRDAQAAFRLLRESRHTGKIVLRVPQPPDPTGTVLVTGGTGGLGALVARHLAERHGMRHLLLVSRRGAGAPGAAELCAELAEHGCEADLATCDVSDRAQLERLLSRIPSDRPLTAIFHAAGTLDDGILTALDPHRLERVLAPKVDAAVHLDELTRDLELSEFVLFSSAAGTLGTPGQANYAAANTFLDALAQRRRAEGRPAMSLAFGVWQRATGMTGHLSADDGVRVRPLDMLPLPDELGLELIDLCRAVDEPLLVPMRLDLTALQERARHGVLPSILGDLVRTRASTPTVDGPSLAGDLLRAPEAERDRVVLDLVREQVAAVLGHASPDAIDSGLAFKDLGVDSLAAVELRNRLGRVTGLRLPASLVFDFPRPVDVARRLLSGLVGEVEVVERKVGLVSPRVDEPVAIVGMGCRFPGGVRSAVDLWRLVVAGGDATGEFPLDRGWDLERLFGGGERFGCELRSAGWFRV